MVNQTDNIFNKIQFIKWVTESIDAEVISASDLKSCGIRASQACFLSLAGDVSIAKKSFSFSKTYPNTLAKNLPLRNYLNECIEDLNKAINKKGKKKRRRSTVTEDNKSLKKINKNLAERNKQLASQLVVMASTMQRQLADLEHYKNQDKKLRRHIADLERDGKHHLKPVK